MDTSRCTVNKTLNIKYTLLLHLTLSLKAATSSIKHYRTHNKHMDVTMIYKVKHGNSVSDGHRTEHKVPS